LSLTLNAEKAYCDLPLEVDYDLDFF